MKILIVDDEPLALARLSRLLNSLDYTAITQVSSADEAISTVKTAAFDIAFLDISMADSDGITLGHTLRRIDDALAIVYQTAHEKYALEAFDVGAVDYLLKPYTAEMLSRAIERVKLRPKEIRLMSKAGDNQYLLTPKEIFYVKADLSEVIFRTEAGFSYYPKKISEVEAILEPHGFMRIHRSYLINLNHIKEMETIDQSRIRFTFATIKESIESSKEGAKHFRHLYKLS